jgi:hypothetical protein
LEFAPFQSFFVVFRKKIAYRSAADVSKASFNILKFSKLKEITGAWNVNFQPEWGGPDSIVFATLTDWVKHPEASIKYYSGTATYSKQFELTESELVHRLFLDLGVVKNIASVRLNGKDLGIIWTAPWRVEITKAARSGDNLLEIEVTNLWPNRLIGDAALSPDKRITRTNISLKKDATLLSSGLLGPVEILVSHG